MNTLDTYLPSKRSASRRNEIGVFVNVVLNTLRLVAEPAGRTMLFKLEALVDVMFFLQGREGYARRDRICDMLIMKSVVDTEDELAQLMRIAHRLGIIKEQGIINGAWTTGDWSSWPLTS